MTIVVQPSSPQLLSDYQNKVRQLLHDANKNYYTDAQVNGWINQARNRVVVDTGCNRSLLTVNLSASVETYQFPTPTTVDVLNVTVLWGTQRVPLNNMPWTQFNLQLRPWQTFVSRPTTFSVFGGAIVYVGPIPDQTYVSEWDCVVLPPVLVNTTDADVINFPFTEPVAYYAAYLGKEYDQTVPEANRFLEVYKQKVFVAIRSSFTRRIPNAYVGG